jgi:hypothetical protein
MSVEKLLTVPGFAGQTVTPGAPDYDRLRKVYNGAEQIARTLAARSTRSGDGAVRCEALLAAGHALAAADITAAEATFDEALPAAEAERLAVPRALALAALAGLDVLRVRGAERVEQARDAALECGMATVTVVLAHDLAMLSLLHFDLVHGRRWADETVASGRRYRLGWVLAAGLVKQAFAAALADEAPEAERLLTEAEPLAGGDPRGIALIHGHVRAAAALDGADVPAPAKAAASAAALWWEHGLERCGSTRQRPASVSS